ncbi:dTDP-4-dehydrorhamnose reductase family protein [Solimicrobium silvestre]|uniref:dTDP-4-dehydrorhamnose reductase n=1 Tax=Solimicrobium silvestre TaxID=2099400 RepID=A0A2S9GYC7_9BURK|nr:SDR family oxidoreductase [Solimicrobium silvestre]PRC92708.1 dTDP-4-dehydrorhamnose reductase [Solimicrobium silvestre]
MNKVLVLGISGMLGNAVFRLLSSNSDLMVHGTSRTSAVVKYFSDGVKEKIICGVDVESSDGLVKLFASVKPDVVINCIGLVKQLAEAKDVLSAIPINTLLPHRLAHLCAVAQARLVHISTDCVFDGQRGNYVEQDKSDAEDLYGKSKFLGEVDYPHAITLRTSIIGHELNGAHSLVNWFLKQEGGIKGYTRAIFSGLPTVELARVINDFVLPNPQLSGLYHVSAEPISKYDLLKLISAEYGKQIDIAADDQLVLDRSLDSSRFKTATGYVPPTWSELVARMREFN